MPILSLYHHGVSAGCPPSKTNGQNSAKRSSIIGWSHDACRRNVRFLWSIRQPELTGHGYALTLTLKHCPQTNGEWERLRRSYIKRLERLGLIRSHWVTEWQRRGVPHLHFAIWTPEPVDRMVFINHWLDLTFQQYGAETRSQHVTELYDAIGWAKYCAKHASRGVGHYQRSSDAIPRQWTKTGRMWGHTGAWPVDEAIKMDVCRKGFAAYRRICKNWRIADARASGSAARIKSARKMLKCPDPNRSAVRGTAEWLPGHVHGSLLTYLAASGYHVEYR